MRKVKTWIVLVILLVTAGICVGGGYYYLSNAKKEFAEAEKLLPESAISEYLKKVENNDFDGLYEDSLIVSPHLNSKEDYIAEMESIYGDLKASDISFVQSDVENEYILASDGKYLATVKLLQDNNGKWIASTEFSGNNSYTIEVPAGMSLTVNGLDVDDTYLVASNVNASNFSDENIESYSVKVDRYELNNLLGEPEISVGEGYTTIIDVLTNTILVGKENTDSSLTETFKNYAITCASFPAKETTVGSVQAISLRGSDWYSRISGMQNTWFTSHSVSNFSNVNATNIIQQSDDTAIGYVTFDYYASNGTVDRTWHGGYQMTLVKESGTWKIAAFGIDVDLNPESNN